MRHTRRMAYPAKLLAEASAQGGVDAASAKYLSAGDQLALVRRSSPASEREGLQGLASQRAGQVAALEELHQTYTAHGLASLDPKTAAPVPRCPRRTVPAAPASAQARPPARSDGDRPLEFPRGSARSLHG